MHHNTYDRFSGCWWGGIIGQSFVPQSQVSTTQTWQQERRQIAQILLKELSPTDFYNHGTIQSASNISSQVKNLKYSSNLLSWLSLIIFPSNKYSLALKTKQNDSFISKDAHHYLFVDEEVLIWRYLLNTILNQQFDLLTKKTAIEQIINSTQVTESSLIDKLQLVLQEIQKGSSLVQVMEQLVSKKQQQPETEIALAWYCFATTPSDFRLSVQKASRLESKLGTLSNAQSQRFNSYRDHERWSQASEKCPHSSHRLITALTGTLSGAYNGMAVISQGWTIDREQDWCWQLENQLLLKLFKCWLGVYNVGRDYESYNLKLDAIAPPKFIQPRRQLKKIIISQI